MAKSRATGYIIWFITLLISSLISVKGESFAPLLLLLNVVLLRCSKPASAWAEQEARECLLIA